MVDIFYPEINISTRHVGDYFTNTPASTSSVFFKDFEEGRTFSSDSLGFIAGRLRSEFTDDTFISAEEYRASKYFREGLNVPQDGIKLSVAESLANSFDERFRRNLTLSRAKGGFGIAAGRFGAGVVGSLFDPVNIGAAFLGPVAFGLNGTLRAAAIRATTGITQKYGVTTGRIVSGAGEGALASLAVEPINLAGRRIQQDPEYGAFDAFVNITAGSILGGTVTGVGGKFSDTFRRASPETVKQSLRASIAQLSEGVPVRVDAIVDADPVVGPAQRARAKVIDAVRSVNKREVKQPKPNEVPPSLKRAYVLNPKTKETKLPLTITQFVKNKGKIDTGSVLQGELKSRLDQGSFGVRKKGGLGIDDMALAAQEEGFFPDLPDSYVRRVTPEELVDALERDSGFGDKVFSAIDEDAQEYFAAIQLDEEVDELGINPKGMTDEELFAEIELRRNALTEEETLQLERSKGPGISREQLDEEIARVQEQFEQSGDLEEFFHPQEEIDMLAKAYDTRLRTENSRVASFDKDIEVLEKQVQALRGNQIVSEEEFAEFAEWDEIIANADEMESVVEATAYCVMRNLNV